MSSMSLVSGTKNEHNEAMLNIFSKLQNIAIVSWYIITLLDPLVVVHCGTLGSSNLYASLILAFHFYSVFGSCKCCVLLYPISFHYMDCFPIIAATHQKLLDVVVKLVKFETNQYGYRMPMKR